MRGHVQRKDKNWYVVLELDREDGERKGEGDEVMNQGRPGRAAGVHLIAERDGRIVGFLRYRYDGQIEHLVGQDAAQQQAIARALVDKALLKMRSLHVGRCQIRLPGAEAQRQFWAAARWLDAAAPPGDTAKAQTAGDTAPGPTPGSPSANPADANDPPAAAPAA